MSTLRVNTIQDSSGSGSPAINGLAKAWVNFNGTGTPAIRAGYNVSSITDLGTGTYDVNMTNAMLDIDFATSLNLTDDSTANRGINEQGGIPGARTTSKFRITIYAVGVGGQDAQGVFATVFR